MEDFISTNQSELLQTAITVFTLLILKFIGNTAVKRIGRLSGIVKARTLLITKYISLVLLFLGVGLITFIWGVNYRELGLLFSSVFAVIGVALFAQWSILSNITAGVILFFSFPFKIGDQIKIMDKDIAEDNDMGYSIYHIEDIKAFHVHLRNSKGELITYPNSLMLQKGVMLISTYNESQEGIE